MKHCPYLFRRNGIYYFRRVFPKDLQSIIGRREIVRTLGTAHKKPAWRLAILMTTELEQLFDRIREGIDLLSPEQQEIFIQDKRQEKTQTLMKDALVKYRDRKPKDIEWESFHARTYKQEMELELSKSNYNQVTAEVDALIKKEKLPLASDDPVYAQICRAVMQAWILYYSDAIPIINSDFDNPVLHSKAPPPAIQEKESTSADHDPKHLFETVIAKYLQDFKSSWSAKHTNSQISKINHFLEFIGNGSREKGNQTELRAVTAADVDPGCQPLYSSVQF